MKTNASVTVVVPAYQAARFLPRALQSLHEQTVAPQQVIVVDDGSTDETAAVAATHGATVIQQQQRGPGAARNRGVELARTEYIAFLDADDWYVPEKLQQSVELLERLDAACCATDAWLVSGESAEVIGTKNMQRFVPPALTEEQLLRGNPVVCSTVVLRRQAFENAGGFDESPELIATEDYDLWLRLSRREPIAYAAQPCSYYRLHSGGLSANHRFLQGVDRILERVAAQHAGEAHFLNLVRRRRAGVRLDLAWDLLGKGHRVEARQLIGESWSLAPSWKGLKLGLRMLLGGGAR